MIENHNPAIEIREITDPVEVWDKQHSAMHREPGYLDDRTQERCPEGDNAQEGREDCMNAKESIGPEKHEQ